VLRIQRALLGELLFVFLLITTAVTSAVFLGITMRFVYQGGGALGSALLLAVLPKLVPTALSYSVPFSWLAATALVLGRWVADHECVAIKAAGVHLRAIVIPLVAVGCLLGVGGIFFNLYVVPTTNREVQASLKDFVPQFLSSLRGADRSVTFDNGRLSFDHWDEEDGAFVAVEMDRRDWRGALLEKAVMERLRLAQVGEEAEELGLSMDLSKAYLFTMPQGQAEATWRDQAPFVMGRVERIGASTLFNQFFGLTRFLHRPRDMTVSELAYSEARGGIARGGVHEVRIAFHGRMALGASGFFLGFFAMAVVLLLPPSGRRVRDFMLCFLPAVLLFFPLHMTGPSLSRETALPGWAAMWSPNLVILAVSLLLLIPAFRR
jgi:lipopolysaccharide export LptBFGC system permease protein LptF